MKKLAYVVLLVSAAGCASTASGGDNAGDDVVCTTGCGVDQDADGIGAGDLCPDTPAGEPINGVGYADSQVGPGLEPDFPPFGLAWTPTGDLGRAGGLTWTYAGIERADLFHIYWVICDETAPCGISLNGPIDSPSESWVFSAADSDPAGGTVVFTNTTSIVTETASTYAVSGRLTVSIVDATDAPLPFANVHTLGIPARAGFMGAELPGTAFKVTVLAEVTDGTSPLTPYLDYYDAATTSDTGAVGGAQASFAGSFYAE